MNRISLTLNANAKLNLTLDIVGKRPDGYHNIDTVMQEIDLHDTVTVTLIKSGIKIICDNPDIPLDDRNIAYKSAELFLKKSNMNTGVEIHIMKRIPVMAGLGGSSTDGAAVLKGLNRLCAVGENGEHGVFSESELCEMGASLGADVPFCIVGGRARCRGIGDEIEILSDLERQFYVIVQSDFLCDTKKAYSLYSPNVNRTKSNVFMDLYDDERIERVCDDLMNAGAKSACMTGSGSAVFGVFFDSNSAKSVYNKINYPFKTIACNVRRQS